MKECRYMSCKGSVCKREGKLVQEVVYIDRVNLEDKGEIKIMRTYLCSYHKGSMNRYNSHGWKWREYTPDDILITRFKKMYSHLKNHWRN